MIAIQLNNDRYYSKYQLKKHQIANEPLFRDLLAVEHDEMGQAVRFLILALDGAVGLGLAPFPGPGGQPAFVQGVALLQDEMDEVRDHEDDEGELHVPDDGADRQGGADKEGADVAGEHLGRVLIIEIENDQAAQKAGQEQHGGRVVGDESAGEEGGGHDHAVARGKAVEIGHDVDGIGAEDDQERDDDQGVDAAHLDLGQEGQVDDQVDVVEDGQHGDGGDQGEDGLDRAEGEDEDVVHEADEDHEHDGKQGGKDQGQVYVRDVQDGDHGNEGSDGDDEGGGNGQAAHAGHPGLFRLVHVLVKEVLVHLPLADDRDEQKCEQEAADKRDDDDVHGCEYHEFDFIFFLLDNKEV